MTKHNKITVTVTLTQIKVFQLTKQGYNIH